MVSKKYGGRSGGAWRRKRAMFRRRCERDNLPCALCGKPIDYTLTGKQPQAFNVDHIIPLSQLPEGDRRREDMSNFSPTHMSCNVRKGNGLPPPKQSPTLKPVWSPNQASSRDWL